MTKKATAKKTAAVPKPAKPVTIPKGAITTADLATRACVDPVTVSLWRAGSPKRTPLPFHTIPRGKQHLVYFKEGEVKAWAKKNGVSIAAAMS